MITALNTLNELMQGECCTMIDFAEKVRAFKEKLELWNVKVENKKFTGTSFPIFNSSIEDLDPEPNLMTLASFVILEHLHTLRKNFEECILENINNYVWIKKSIYRKCGQFYCRISFRFSGTVD